MDLLFHIYLFFLSIDRLWLRPLQKRVPDFQEVLASPHEALQEREIEIGPWTRYVRNVIIIFLVLIASMVVSVFVGELSPRPEFQKAVAIGLLLAWPVISIVLIRAGRGGVCVLRSSGVEFRHHGVSVVCPWDLFHAAGQPVYYEPLRRLDLPVQQAALDRIQVHRDGAVIGEGRDVQVKHFQVLASGEIRLRVVWGINPTELGSFLLQLGGKLGKPIPQGAVRALAPAPAQFVRRAKGDWIVVTLTQLRLPAVCCACCQTTDRWRAFPGFRSLFSTEFSATYGEQYVTLAALLCANCQKLQSRRYWRTYFKTVGLTLVGAPPAGLLVGMVLDICGVPATASFVMAMCGVIVGLGLSWFIAAKVAQAASEPMFLSDYRPGEGTIRVWFRNPRYGQLFLAAMENVTGVTRSPEASG